MSDERQPVKSYAGGIEARMSAAQEERRKNSVIPNLGEAAVTQGNGGSPYNLSDLAAQQRADAEEPDKPRPRGLSPQTIEGLAAVRQEQDRRAEAARPRDPEPLPSRDPAPDEVADELASPDDIEMMAAIRTARKDAIQNERERQAVAKRVPPIDIAQGLITGEFTQRVPIVPNVLEVEYRCLSTGEFDALRLYLFKQVKEDPRLSEIASNLLSFYQTVASVMALNKTRFGSHMLDDAGGLSQTFSEEAFALKLAKFRKYPAVLNMQLNLHGVWFEQRVRELFTTPEALKNG